MIKKFLFTSLGLLVMSASCGAAASERTDAITHIKQISHQKSMTDDARLREARRYVYSLGDRRLEALVNQLGANRFIHAPQFRANRPGKAGARNAGYELRRIIQTPALRARLQQQVASFLFHIAR